MLGGHLDSWHVATGATDNAVGCTVMMEAARILKALGVKPRRTIRIALWSGDLDAAESLLAGALSSLAPSAALAPSVVSSLGAVPFDFDGWGIDVAVGGSQKALSASKLTPDRTAENLRMIYKGADRSIPTSQQFTYGWYRKDLFDAKKLAAPKSWDDYLKSAKALNDPPNMYGCIVPSAETGASTLLLETMFMKNDVHWFEWNAGKKEYEVSLDKGKEFIQITDKSSPAYLPAPIGWLCAIGWSGVDVARRGYNSRTRFPESRQAAKKNARPRGRAFSFF